MRIQNYATISRIWFGGAPGSTVEEITTPYGPGWRVTSGGGNWQWFRADLSICREPTEMDEPILRVMLRSSGTMSFRLGQSPDSTPKLLAEDHWSAVDTPLEVKPNRVESFYPVPEGEWVEISSRCLLVERTDLELLDESNPTLKVFDSTTLPLPR